MDFIFLFLQNAYNTALHERKSVIIFDEVQQCPKARQAIKYLVKDGRYDYIETGSLISIHKSTKDISIPSEEHRIEMFPMDYEEFRWAMGDNASIPLLRQVFDKKMSLGEGVNRLKCENSAYICWLAECPKLSMPISTPTIYSKLIQSNDRYCSFMRMTSER